MCLVDSVDEVAGGGGGRSGSGFAMCAPKVITPCCELNTQQAQGTSALTVIASLVTSSCPSGPVKQRAEQTLGSDPFQ